jgi:hypothetical protein
MLNVGKLEPFGIFALAGGILYSIGVLTVESEKTNYRSHFIVLTLLIFTALCCICLFKYLKCRFQCQQMDSYIAAMKIK